MKQLPQDCLDALAIAADMIRDVRDHSNHARLLDAIVIHKGCSVNRRGGRWEVYCDRPEAGSLKRELRRVCLLSISNVRNFLYRKLQLRVSKRRASPAGWNCVVCLFNPTREAEVPSLIRDAMQEAGCLFDSHEKNWLTRYVRHGEIQFINLRFVFPVTAWTSLMCYQEER